MLRFSRSPSQLAGSSRTTNGRTPLCTMLAPRRRHRSGSQSFSNHPCRGQSVNPEPVPTLAVAREMMEKRPKDPPPLAREHEDLAHLGQPLAKRSAAGELERPTVCEPQPVRVDVQRRERNELSPVADGDDVSPCRVRDEVSEPRDRPSGMDERVTRRRAFEELAPLGLHRAQLIIRRKRVDEYAGDCGWRLTRALEGRRARSRDHAPTRSALGERSPTERPVSATDPRGRTARERLEGRHRGQHQRPDDLRGRTSLWGTPASASRRAISSPWSQT